MEIQMEKEEVILMREILNKLEAIEKALAKLYRANTRNTSYRRGVGSSGTE